MVYSRTSASTWAGVMCRAAATRSTWMAALADVMSGSSPDAEPVTASDGIFDTGTRSNAAICFCACSTNWTWAGLVGPRFYALEYSGLQPQLSGPVPLM